MNISNLIFPYDYVLLIIAILIVIISTLKGFVSSILGLFTWIGSILLTIYSYENLSNVLTHQILKINFFQNYEYWTNILSIIISIPIIFILTIFVLRKIKKFMSSDLNYQLLGLILDKLFGLIYGLIFTYLVFTASLIMIERLNFNSTIIYDNSNIIFYLDNINNKYFNFTEPADNLLDD